MSGGNLERSGLSLGLAEQGPRETGLLRIEPLLLIEAGWEPSAIRNFFCFASVAQGRETRFRQPAALD